jgi:hypothetical protein
VPPVVSPQKLLGVAAPRYSWLVPVELESWNGLVGGRTDPLESPVIEVPIKPSARGGSGTFLAADGHGTQWWVKPLNNTQGARVTITESIVGAVGHLINAPVCETSVVRLPDEIAGWEFRPGHTIEPGFAHGSLSVAGVQEDRSLLFRDRDDNARRHAGVFALYDWCWGGDDQWLYAEPEDRQLYSHDHGWYLPEIGPTWSAATLGARVDELHQPPWPKDGLDKDEVSRLTTALRDLQRAELLEALSRIPVSWPVDDRELEAVGWFLDRRRTAVAERLEALGGEL